MDLLDYTPDVARESLAQRAVNYSPTICLALFILVYPFAGGYLWTNLCISYLGIWGWIPTAAVFILTALAAITFYFRSFPRARRLIHQSNNILERCIRYGCRTICVFAHMLSVIIALQSLFMIIAAIQQSEPWLTVTLITASFAGTTWYLRLFYFWYWRCRYEGAILAENSKMYGNPVFVSIPIFKFCGHFVLIIDGHKYELRLDARCGRPLFNDRPLPPSEEDLIRGTIRNHIVLVGWTRKEPQDIRAIFQRLANSFGSYHRIKNNCRHFLQFGCMDVLDVLARWDENMLLVGTDNLILLPKTVIMMWRAISREFFRFVWERVLGHDWESKQVLVPPGYFSDLGDPSIDLSDD